MTQLPRHQAMSDSRAVVLAGAGVAPASLPEQPLYNLTQNLKLIINNSSRRLP